MTWVYRFPEWLFVGALVVAMSALTAAGLALYRRIVPQSEDVAHNDVAGPIISTVGTLLAVILSFVLVSVWQEYDQAAATVVQESSAMANLYHAALSFPEPTRSQLRSEVRSYVNTIIDSEWPAMRSGYVSAAATNQSLHILGTVTRYLPRTAAQEALQQNAIGFIDTALDARRDRIFDNAEGIPLIFWFGILMLSLVTIGCSFIFRIRNQAMHAFMSVALAAVIAVTWALIAIFDYPFRGAEQIAPTPWLALQSAIQGTASPMPTIPLAPSALPQRPRSN